MREIRVELNGASTKEEIIEKIREALEKENLEDKKEKTNNSETMAEIKVKQNEDEDEDEGNIEIDLDFKGNTFDLLNITLLAFSKFLAGLKGIDEGMID